MTHHTATTGPAPATLTDLLITFADRWTIEFESALRVWSAERRSPDGRRRHFICDDRPADLFTKLAAAETGAQS